MAVSRQRKETATEKSSYSWVECEASDVDLKVYDQLKGLGWKLGDTMLYQPSYALTHEEQREFPSSRSIKPDYEFGIDRGISEGFLAPYTKTEIITDLTRQAMEAGIVYDHLLDPDTRERVELSEEQKIELERLNRKILSEEQARRWAEEIRKHTAYGEKVILFAASQAHCLMLVKALNDAFNDPGDEGPRYAEAIISENDDLNDALKGWFEKPYQNPRVVVSVDIMSTGVDVPCVRYIAFGALTNCGCPDQPWVSAVGPVFACHLTAFVLHCPQITASCVVFGILFVILSRHRIR